MSDLLNRLEERAKKYENKYRSKSQFYYGRREKTFTLVDALSDNSSASIGESQIEDALIIALLKSDWSPWRAPVLLKEGDKLPTGNLFISPQFQFGKYRADLMIVCKSNGQTKYLCIECDGDAYHQSEPYRIMRDGYFAAFGIKTLRFSGHDCRTHTQLCANKIIRELADWEAGL